ncbi:MAG: hypothetical protein RL632_1638 [Bacteroidota bacterium]|jgi:8-oxo-dGTP pyrophosphatase MutT (NUDIX family)
MYKVFVENRPVIFTQNSETDSLSLCLEADEVEDVNLVVRNRIELISHNKPLVIHCADAGIEFNRLFLRHDRVSAAGGVVRRWDDILFIRKNDMWDLPKGFVDFGETIAETAYREISEECGIEGHVLTRKLIETWHTYTYHDRPVLKQTHWFEFQYSGTKRTIPQVEEGISDAVWISKNQFNTVLNECYGSVRDVLEYF